MNMHHSRKINNSNKKQIFNRNTTLKYILNNKTFKIYMMLITILIFFLLLCCLLLSCVSYFLLLLLSILKHWQAEHIHAYLNVILSF